ncbi:MAG: hypothetical protein COB85_05870 [Bacteroidetes bacterium]|nr:MAG: hypothetical protein COB85_05870 [Bacteroidota bacterium]
MDFNLSGPKKAALAVTLIAIFITISLEVFIRARYFELLKIRAYPLIYKPDIKTGYKYRPNTKAKICIPGVCKTFMINNNGYYGPSFEVAKDQNIFRIAVVGSSESTGIWMQGDENFSMKLQNLCNKVGCKVEVLNFARDGRWRGVYSLNIIKQDVMRYQPDIVLLNTSMPLVRATFGRDIYKGFVLIYNLDSEYSKKWCKDRADYILDQEFLTHMYDISYIVRAATRYYWMHVKKWPSSIIKSFVTKRIQAKHINHEPLTIKSSLDLIQEMQERLHSIQSKLLLFEFEHNKEYTLFANNHKLPYINLGIQNNARLLNPYNKHFNERGHEVIARKLYSKLVNGSYIPDHCSFVEPES